MKTIYAPWRHSYVKKDKKNLDAGCLFCQKIGEGVGVESLVVCLSENFAVLLNKYPYSVGHLMILPRDHIGRFQDLDPSSLAEQTELIEKSMKVLKSALGATAFHVGYNLGRVGGAGIPEHLHAHVVPRYEDDENYDVSNPVKNLNFEGVFELVLAGFKA